jgi:eight-cysteine-cluster-containing protein
MSGTPMVAAVLAVLVACGAHTPAPAPGSGGEARVTVTVPPRAPPVTPDVDSGSPRSATMLYESARVRVEGAEAPGECASDTDCARAGCSQEVCVPAGRAGAVITTCEILPVFSALDACGCHAGACTWTLKEPVLRAFPVPPKTPPAGSPG